MNYRPPNVLPGSNGIPSIRPIKGLALAACAGLTAVIAAELFTGLVNVQRIGLIGEALSGSGDLPALNSNDNLYALTGQLQAVALLAAAVLFICWLFRARANSEALVPIQQHRRSKPWLVFAWVVPIVNLWFPKQIVDDIWSTSNPTRATSYSSAHPSTLQDAPKLGLIWAWWLMFIGYEYVSRIFTKYLIRADTLEELKNAAIAELVLGACGIATAILATKVVRRISDEQERSMRGAPEPTSAVAEA